METRQPHAVVPPLGRAAALDAGVPVRLQWIVDMGAEQAEALLPDLFARSLRDHVVALAAAFRRAFSVEASSWCRHDDGLVTAATNAFVAGLLGRLQQHFIAHAATLDRDADLHGGMPDA